MTVSPGTAPAWPPRSRARRVTLLLVAAGVAALLAANAHLVYVAVTSQPGCVPHSKDAGSGMPGSPYRAAGSAC